MKRTLAIAICIAVGGGLAHSDDKAGQNLLKNGGFEDKVDAKGIPAGWIVGAEGGEAQYKVITEKPKEGKNCLRIKGNFTWAAAFVRLPVEKGKTYKLTGYARASSGMAVIKFDYFKGGEHLGQTLQDTVQDAEWKEISLDSEIDQHEGATHFSATVAALGESECDFDGLVLTAK